ncbi:MAG: gamma-glutamylcyclotransferase [Clostridium sp.]|jgi:gamma-glutamylcyclotransferase (GGCT)/AIG2-like uncharacterized protein YtfP|nr:gamma-glutamylcyclotransferase [Clostridium sp.]
MKTTPKANTKRLYFAYGSNCNLYQMARRCPSAAVVGAVTLPNYALGFNGKQSGWGVANIRRKSGATVHGLLWEITPECERSLDRYEGYPHLYEKRNVTVYGADGTAYKAMVYVMTAYYREPALPSKGYYDGIAAGFWQNEIPTDTLTAALDETYEKAGRYQLKMEGIRA